MSLTNKGSLPHIPFRFDDINLKHYFTIFLSDAGSFEAHRSGPDLQKSEDREGRADFLQRHGDGQFPKVRGHLGAQDLSEEWHSPQIQGLQGGRPGEGLKVL